MRYWGFRRMHPRRI
uniref:DnaJ protein homolog ANJ1-like n=1 Tax=Rhizophora mucronata TaxID=61149 RepID=A0A2P2M7G3_RHIMU